MEEAAKSRLQSAVRPRTSQKVTLIKMPGKQQTPNVDFPVKTIKPIYEESVVDLSSKTLDLKRNPMDREVGGRGVEYRS